MARISQSKAMDLFDWFYRRAVEGLGSLESAESLAKKAMEKPGSLEEQVDGLIRSQALLSATTGFLTGLGGLLTLPVTLPVSVTSGLYFQTRLVLALARMSGADPEEPRVKMVVLACLCGNAAKGLLRQMGVRLGTRVTQAVLEAASAKLLVVVQRTLGRQLALRLGQRSLSNLAKLAPLAGGLIGAGVDAAATRTVGRVAKQVFFGKPFQEPKLVVARSDAPSLDQGPDLG